MCIFGCELVYILVFVVVVLKLVFVYGLDVFDEM